MKRIYLDNAATTPLDPQVLEVMQAAMLDNYGNPSSIHAEGRRARATIEQARKAVAQHLQASIGEIFFTSGGTEANNMALKGAVRDLGVRRIISSPVEHHCVLHSLDTIQGWGQARVEWVQLDQQGRVDLAQLETLLAAGTEKTLVSLMHANNETGTLLDLEAVSGLCQTYGALLHTDTVQTIGYYPLDLSALRVHFLSGSAHKFHGPKGVGFIYINHDSILHPFIDGGSQERNMRGGTENLYGIVGLAKALELAYAELDHRRAHITALRDYLRDQLRARFPEATFNGDPEGGHYKLLSVSFPPSARASLLLLNLDIAGVSVSGGSACSSGADAGSHVIGHLHPDSERTTIRFSFSHLNTLDEVNQVLQKLSESLP